MMPGQVGDKEVGTAVAALIVKAHCNWEIACWHTEVLQ